MLQQKEDEERKAKLDRKLNKLNKLLKKYKKNTLTTVKNLLFVHLSQLMKSITKPNNRIIAFTQIIVKNTSKEKQSY